MNLEVTGKIVKIMAEESGSGRTGKAWVKQSFVIETFEQYPKKICIVVWGDKVSELKQYQPGQDVRASIDIESREFNDRWYTDVKAWKLEPMDGAAAGKPAAASNRGGQSAGYGNAPSFGSEAYQYSENDIPADTSADDLPF